jgi:ribosome-binding protein aMBF1 (putative translation factor)
MIGDLIATMADAEGSSVTVRPRSSSVIGIETSDVATLVAVMLRREREKHGLSAADVAKRLRHS